MNCGDVRRLVKARSENWNYEWNAKYHSMFGDTDTTEWKDGSMELEVEGNCNYCNGIYQGIEVEDQIKIACLILGVQYATEGE